MTSAPTRPLSSVNSWERPGWAWNASCKGAYAWLGEGACWSQDSVCWPSKEPECPSHGQAGTGMTRFLDTKEVMTTSCCCPNSWLPKGRDRGCQAKKACCSCPHPGADPSRCLDLAWAASHPHGSSCPICGGLQCRRVWPDPLSTAP
ncbi:hypothetical protein mRhiFer1_008906 [Rhinolophus ferrumequinum]|uniref:Uncharacterized protein n=1 Tax=Rhinolophus ferrumequinum TaxID=59479 RepID=A0A7J7TDQ9_RHIFE|nr:hypothetical protein mRhiFer1_008906 [Rhinolophus ferrumequinum]